MSHSSQHRLKILAGALALAFAGEASAVILTVTSNADTLTAGTLRTALSTASNDCGCTGAPYTINFAFPAPGPTTITMTPALGSLISSSCTTFIDGYDQSPTPANGATPNAVADIRSGSDASPRVILDASGVSGAALIVQSPGSVVKGLVFQNYGTTAIRVQAANVSIQGNHIGTNAAGTACAGAGNGIGIEAVFGQFAVGGPNAADRNVIGCSSGSNPGIEVTSSLGDIAGNLIGTGAGGQALPNGVGVRLNLPNGGDVNVGFPSLGQGNLIAQNAGPGVVAYGNGTGAYVQGNDIFLNGGLGFDLDSSGNIPIDGDGPNTPNGSLTPNFSLPNGGINRPQIDYVRYDAANTTIDWSFNGFANSTVFVDFYANPPGLGIDEGARWAGIGSAITTGSGAAAGSLAFVGIQPSPTATATIFGSGTSEFSPAAALDVTPRFLNFGSVGVGTSSAPQTVTFTNQGSSSVTIGPPVTVGSFSALASGCDGITLIGPGNSCTVDVTFNPIILGLGTDSLDLSTSGTGGGRGIELTGNAVAVPNIAASPPGPIDFGSVGLGTPSTPTTITFSNAGTGDLVISSVGVTGGSASSFLPLVTDGCTGATLNTSTPTCTVTVRMTPLAVGALAASLVVASNDADTPNLAVPLSGTGLPPVINANPVGPVNFGDLRLGTTSAPTTITLSNSGAGNLTISGVTVTGAAAPSFTVNSSGCITTLNAANPTCTMTAAMTPQTAGTLAANILVASNDPVTPSLPIGLSGTGLEPILASNPAGPVNFGTVVVGSASVVPVAVSFTNSGNGSLTLSGPATITGTAASSFRVVTDGCVSQTLTATPPTSCTITLEMAPQAVGTLAADLQVSSDATNPSFVLALAGTGVAAPPPVPVIGSSPAGPINFGGLRVGTSSPPTSITFSNSGTGDLIIAGPTITGASASSFTVNSTACTSPLNSSNPTCTMFVVMTPQVAGALAAALVVPSNDAATPSLSIGLSGSGLTPVLASNPAGPINFGTAQVGLTSPQVPVTFTNSGTGSLLVGGATLTGAAASSFQVVANGCAGQTLTATPPTSCTLTLAMQPQAVGALAATLQVSSDATNPNFAVALAGTGSAVPVPPPFIGATPAGPVDFGPRRTGTQSPPTVFKVEPSGPGPVAISSVAPLGTDFTVVSDTCTGASIAQGSALGFCSFSVIFAPTFEGAYRTMIQVLSNAANRQLLVEVTGTGTPLPVGRLSASPGSVPFGTQVIGVTTNPQTVQVTNTGTLPVTVGTVRATGDFAQINDCRLLDFGQSCRAFVTFTPTVLGERFGNLIVDSDATNPQLVVSLQGTASPAPVPAVELNPGAVSFGTSFIGSGGGTVITLRNSGGASLVLGRIYPIGDFRVTHNCPTSLPPGASCPVTVSFAPSITGSRTGKLVVESNAPGGNKEAPLSGTGCRNFGVGTARLGAPICR